MPNKNIPLWATLLMVTAVIFGVFLVMKQKERPQIIEEFVSDTPAVVLSTGVTFIDFINPDDWKLKEQAEESIQSLGEGQYIQLGVVRDPVQEDISYFASAAFNEETEENGLSIYRYNERTYDFERLFRGSFGQGGSSYLHEEAWPVWRTIGYDKNGLIILLQDGDSSPGQCAQPLLIGAANDETARLLRLDLSDPSSGLSVWTAPQELVEAAEEHEADCQEAID